MLYTKASIMSVFPIGQAIQNGTGRTAQHLPKDSVFTENPLGSDPSGHMSTTGAYEADE